MKRKHIVYLGLMLFTLILNLFLPSHLHTLSVCILIGVLLCVWSTEELFFTEWFHKDVDFKTKWPFLVLLLLAISCESPRTKHARYVRENNATEFPYGELLTIKHDGCLFIIYQGSQQGGIIHHPKCNNH